MNSTLSQRIELELRNIISGGVEPSFRLTFVSIAKHFGVSIQPVRTAVDTLLEERWLLRNAQGRLTMNPEKVGEDFDLPPVPDGQSPDVGAELEKIIIQHSLRGEEVFLREEETAELVGVGRTILRAEFTRMHGRGLVQHIPRRGWQVIGYSESRMLEYLEIRETLELKALDLAKNNLEDAKLERLLKRNTPDAKGRIRIDDSLHAYLIERAGNRFIEGFFSQHGAYHTALFNYASLTGSFLAKMADQHQEIIQGLLEKKISQAKRRLAQHIHSQRAPVAELLARVGDEAARS